MENVLSASEQFIFVTLTSVLAVAGGLLFWVGFAFAAAISRRYAVVFERQTRWSWLFVAPAGFFVYTLLQAVATLRQSNLHEAVQWLGYFILLISAWACWWPVSRYRALLRSLEKESRS